ncbi:MAG: DUF5334 family protein [Sinimarinibacterium flocculans]|uniref:DUF5334 family protein n=1 Tax=Sinimarinibacterium flocculans TaxID=985250 RepID=UPI003C5A1057
MIRILILLLLAAPTGVLSWDGTDLESGSSVEIESGNTVRTGNDIEFYDYGAGEYREGSVESINRYGSGVEVEVYDYESGEYRVLEMDD